MDVYRMGCCVIRTDHTPTGHPGCADGVVNIEMDYIINKTHLIEEFRLSTCNRFKTD